jgi:hypothetical protein
MIFQVMLLMMSANCIAFGTENLVEVVISVKQFLLSGCVYLLQNQEAGKWNSYLFCLQCMYMFVMFNYYIRENIIETYMRLRIDGIGIYVGLLFKNLTLFKIYLILYSPCILYKLKLVLILI